MTIKVKIYDKVKYDPTSRKTAETILENVKGFEMRELSDEEVRQNGFDEFDENKECVKLTLDNGDVATYRSSHADFFKID